MIDSLRRKMIFLSAVSVAIVLSLIFLAIYLIGMRQLNATMDMLTDAISENDGWFPPFDPDRKYPSASFPLMDIFTPETEYSTRFFTIWVDKDYQFVRENVESISSITTEQAKQRAQEILKQGNERGWISDYRYKVVAVEQGYSIVFVDGSMNWAMTRQFLLNSLLVLAGSCFVILFLIIAFSKRAVQPAAESYEKQKQFITDASHELKTPLTLILSNLDIVESEIGKNEWLDDIRTEGKRMGSLIQQLTALSRMDEDHSNLDISDFDLSAVASDTVSEFVSLAARDGKKLYTQIHSPVPYKGDEGLLRRLISILMDNAVKYCDPEGTICFTLSSRRYPVLTVENTYKDVGAAELNRLFDRFYRTDKARSCTGSFGIGLSIAKAIVQNHHGTITAYKKGTDVIGFRVILK